ncbi:MAG: hypothetical protein IKD43_03440 [Clostridia bacterium]|nr:hypothetical protein [Clostridia bacterium]
MIHSLSGGVLFENGLHLFAKVEILGVPYWYLAPFAVEVGDRVLAPLGKADRLMEGSVLKTELCTPQTAPFPMSRIKRLEKKV